MRLIAVLIIPLVVQVFLFIGVFVAAQGGGSFMGLLAIPVAGIALPALIVSGLMAARGTRPIGGALLINMGIAIAPPILLLVFRAIEG